MPNATDRNQYLTERLDMVHSLLGIPERISETLRPCANITGDGEIEAPLTAQDPKKAEELWKVGFKAIEVAQRVLDGIANDVESRG